MAGPIVVGVALRDDDRAPIALGRELAHLTGAPLAVIHVYDREPRLRLPSAAYDDALREQAMTGLARAAQPLRNELEVTVHAEASSSPVRGLHDAAIALDASLLVVGSSHRGAIRRVMPGGVGERLLHAAPCAVALSPRGYAGRYGGIHRLGVAFVDAPEAHEALDAAAVMAILGKAALSTYTVIEPPPLTLGGVGHGRIPSAPYDPGPRLWDTEDRVRAQLPGGVEAEVNVLEGDAAKLLAGASEHLDLLLCGSRGYGPIRTVLAGGVSGRLARMASCPLLVLPRARDTMSQRQAAG